MPSLFSKALVYLGLVDEDPEDDPVISDDDRAGRGSSSRRTTTHNRGEDWEEAEYRADQRRVEGRRPDMRRMETFSRVEGRRVEPPSSASRTTAFRSENVDSPVVRAVRPVDVQADILVVEEFGDAKVLADRVRDRVPVVLDLRRTQPDLVRRVIDFGSGLIYALDGTMNKIGDGLVVVLPPRVVLSRDERRRLQRLGVYELDDED
ncbi:MAG TPA: cell division protein SepF [Acidimicrobiia bacterium]|nr:cell division protein SepF [Acidimicrobiia bacterium]